MLITEECDLKKMNSRSTKHCLKYFTNVIQCGKLVRSFRRTSETTEAMEIITLYANQEASRKRENMGTF